MNSFHKEVDSIRSKRSLFINNFVLDATRFEQILKSAINDNHLNSIRIHKYMTETKLLGKVETARYLDKIGLNEKTVIKNLTNHDIKKLLVLLETK